MNSEGIPKTDLSAFKLMLKSNIVLKGPFQLMLSTPAGFEEIIKYADFKEEVTAIQVDDGSTFEDEPDQDDLWDVISGNITFDKGRVIVLSNGR